MLGGGTMSARKNRPNACINLVNTHSTPAITLAKNANTEPKAARYKKNFIALQFAPYRPRGLAFARGAPTFSELAEVSLTLSKAA
jgi:hypothetical protein